MRDSPGKLIDFAKVRALIRRHDVLNLLSWEPTAAGGAQLRGAYPLPNCSSNSPRTFGAHLQERAWHCFTCGSHGNQLDLWALMTGHDFYRATIDLYHQTGNPVPYHARQQTRAPFNSRSNPPAGPR